MTDFVDAFPLSPDVDGQAAVDPGSSATSPTQDPGSPTENAALERQVSRIVREFHTYLKTRDNNAIGGSTEVAKRSVVVVRDVLAQIRWSCARELMDAITVVGKLLKTGLPSESIVDNMIRRVLLLIREAYSECVAEDRRPEGSVIGTVPAPENAQTLHGLLLAPEETFDFRHPFKILKNQIMLMISELLEELEESTHNIAMSALEHIHSAEVIMTCGHSNTVAEFLLKAGQKRTFHVMVTESAPSLQGQTMAMRLGAAGIETTLVTDSACFALMSRVNKVIIGTHTVMADGGLMALGGSHALALAAKHHSVPVIVCAAMFKLSPQYPCSYDQDDFNHMHSPTEIIGYQSAKVVGKAAIISPLFDYVPPDLISLFVSNIGSNAPSYIYRLLSEYYYTGPELAR